MGIALFMSVLCDTCNSLYGVRYHTHPRVIRGI